MARGDGVLDARDDLDPLVQGAVRPDPRVEGGAGGGDRLVHVRARGVRHPADDLFGVRRDDLDDVPARRIGQLAADEELSVLDEVVSVLDEVAHV